MSRRLTRRTLEQAETAAGSIERPYREARARLGELTDDQRQRVALFVLASLPADQRLEVLARHVPALLPDQLDQLDDDGAETVAALFVWRLDVLLEAQRTDAQRLRLLRHDIP